ncbi:MAG: hypothetical protein ABSE90_09825, partial [Verrucomicrobiota bacterium]
MKILGAPASRRPVGSRKPEPAGKTPALPGTVPRLPRFFPRNACLSWLLLFLSAFIATAQTNPPASCVRSFTNDLAGQPLVTISVTGAAGVACLTIEETLPAAATPASISADGVFLPAQNAI